MELSRQTALTLNNGMQLPVLGFGTYRLSEGALAVQAVSEALTIGYRHLDTASFYGNERSIGQAVRESGLPEGSILVTTKLWKSDHGHRAALDAFEKSYRLLGLPQVSLYLMHWPGEDSDRLDTWRALEQILASGRCKAIGVSNFEIEHLRHILDAGLTVPTVNQIMLNPFNYSEQKALIEFCRAAGIQIIAYTPLGRARRLDDPILTDLARRYGKTPAQVALRWNIQSGNGIIPKSANPERMRQNAALFDFTLQPADMQLLNQISGPLPPLVGAH
jgi:diketogulonate reductase-like aldo/keto reductase